MDLNKQVKIYLKIPTAISPVRSYKPSAREVPSGFRCGFHSYEKIVFALVSVIPFGCLVILSVENNNKNRACELLPYKIFTRFYYYC